MNIINMEIENVNQYTRRKTNRIKELAFREKITLPRSKYYHNHLLLKIIIPSNYQGLSV